MLRTEERAREECVQPEVLDNTEIWFRKFWDLYPKHKAKADAEKSFRKKCQSAEDFNRIMDGLKKICETEWKTIEPRFIPYPATWLNQERWNDDITPRAMSTTEKLDEMIRKEYQREQEGNVSDPEINIFGTWWDKS